MKKIAMAVHGGAGPDSNQIKNNIAEYKRGLEKAVKAGYKVLEKGGSSLDAVEVAVSYLEDDALFNAGRGSVLNENAEIEMDASIMNGKDEKCGAVALVKSVKNPISLARAVMEKTEHIYLGGPGALAFAKQLGHQLRPLSYFVTEYNYEQYEEETKKAGRHPKEATEKELKKKDHGTVGAVALDKRGNLAAATSTGGLEHKKEGRIGDSSIIGVGSFANNKTCAVSCTGDGEFLIQQTTAFHLSALIEYKGLSLQEACTYLIHEKSKGIKGDMGLIAIDPNGSVSMAFNSQRMHRAWMTTDGDLNVFIYPGA